jgi:hypothetical protein
VIPGGTVKGSAQQGNGLGVVARGITALPAGTRIAAVGEDAGACPEVQRDGQHVDLGVQIGILAGFQVRVITVLG